METHHFVCQYCGKEFTDLKHKDRKFCSSVCAGASRQAKRIIRSCPICGTQFETTTHHGGIKTCSRKCANKLRGKGTRKRLKSITVFCAYCGNAKRTPMCRVWKGNHFCNRRCRKAYDKEHSDNIVELVCQICGKPYLTTKGQIKHRGSKYCSRECMSKGFSNNRRGSNNPHWNGGNFVSDYGPNWCSQRRKATRRDNHTCQVCGYKSGGDTILDVHHIAAIKNFNGDWEKANRLSNLICLCRDCHAVIESGKIACPIPSTA